jgi:hypothetical protein
MSRPKGSKNKSKVAAPITNEILNDLKAMGIDPGPVQVVADTHKPAASAFKPEYLDVDAKLQELAQSLPEISDQAPSDLILREEKVHTEFLADHVETYRPAANLTELEHQVFLAGSAGCTSIEGTEALIKYLCKGSFEVVKSGPGYCIYKNIKVHLPKTFQANKAKENRSVYADAYQPVVK